MPDRSTPPARAPRRGAGLAPLALLLGTAFLGTAALRPALAQEAPGATRLHLSETAAVTRAPDEVVATLRAEARGGTAQAAQAAVNTAMAAALERARAAPGVTAATGTYWTQRVENPRGWTASQTLSLRAAELPPLLDLTGQLQERGLAMDGFAFRLTRDAKRKAQEEAASQAIDALRARAEAVARQLGLRVERLAEVRVDSAAEPPPRPFARGVAMSAATAAPPVAQAEDIEVTSTVQAEVLLRAP